MSGGKIGAGHVLELCCAALYPTYGSMHVLRARVLTHREEGAKDVPASKVVKG